MASWQRVLEVRTALESPSGARGWEEGVGKRAEWGENSVDASQEQWTRILGEVGLELLIT